MPLALCRLAIQVGLDDADSRADFRLALRDWAAQSPSVSSWAIDDRSLDAEPHWNLGLSVADIEACWRDLSPVIERFEAPHRASARVCANGEALLGELAPAIVAATRHAHWLDYEILHHTDPKASDRR